MASFLTTREVQDLINVDRSTVYRMAEDGRLPGVKIGRQWRFSADRIAELFGLEDATDAESPAQLNGSDPSVQGLHQLLLPDAAQSIADLLGELFGVMAVVTDIEGRPLTSVANQCGFYAAIADSPMAAAACTRGWRGLADQPDLEPRFVPSHLGFLCARSFIRVGHQLTGMVIVGGIAPHAWPPQGARLGQIAQELSIAPSALLEASDQIWQIDLDHQDWILGLLPRIADLISQLASARSQLLTKLDAIATLAGPVAPQKAS